MRKIFCFLIFLILIPVFAYTEGDAESYIREGLIAEREQFTDPTWEGYERSLRNSIPLYEKAIELSPNNADANLLLARALISVKEYQKTIQTLEAYLTFEPDDKYAHYYLGKAYYEQGNYQKARYIIEKGIDLVGGIKKDVDVDRYNYYHWSAWYEYLHKTVYYALNYLHGKILKELGRYDDAISAYKKTIDERPLADIADRDAREGIIIQELGELYWLNKDQEKAKELLNQLRAIGRLKQWADKLEAIMQDKK